MTGVASGQHGLDANSPILDRLFILESALNAEPPAWHVDGDPNDLVQSAAQALTLDSKGRAIVGGYTCGLPCNSTTSELRLYEPGGMLAWTTQLAPEVALPQDLAWSPAGYVVLVSGSKLGALSSEFFVQAWKPGQDTWLWSYTKNVAPPPHFAMTVAIGPFGQVYTGGIGSNGYPAVAFINP